MARSTMPAESAAAYVDIMCVVLKKLLDWAGPDELFYSCSHDNTNSSDRTSLKDASKNLSNLSAEQGRFSNSSLALSDARRYSWPGIEWCAMYCSRFCATISPAELLRCSTIYSSAIPKGNYSRRRLLRSWSCHRERSIADTSNG